MGNKPPPRPKSAALKEALFCASFSDSYREIIRDATYDLETSFLQDAYRIRDRAQEYEDSITHPGIADREKEYAIDSRDRVFSKALSEPDPSIFNRIYKKIGVNPDGSGSALADLKKIMQNIHLFPGMENYNQSPSADKYGVHSLSPQTAVPEFHVIDDVTEPSRNEPNAGKDVALHSDTMDESQDGANTSTISDDYFIELLPPMDESDDEMNEDIPQRPRKVTFMEEVVVRFQDPVEPVISQYDYAFQSSQSSENDDDYEPPNKRTKLQ